MLDRDEIDRLRWANCTPMGRAAEQARANLRAMEEMEREERLAKKEDNSKDSWGWDYVKTEEDRRREREEECLRHRKNVILSKLDMYIEHVIDNDLQRARQILADLNSRILR